MSKWTLQVAPGEGRLTRRRGRILFMERYDPALAELAGPELDIGMRELAGHAVTDERCPAFVFVDLGDAVLLAHGDPGLEDLSEDGAPLRASSLGFIEKPLGPASVFGCNHGPAAADTSLDEGTVPAAGFLLAGPGSMHGSVADTAPAAAESQPEPPPVQPVVTPTHAPDDGPGAPSSPARTESGAAPADPVDGWDPWQRDPGIDLSLIGSPPPAAFPGEAAAAPPAMFDESPDPTPLAPTNDTDLIDVDESTEIVRMVQPRPVEPAPAMEPGHAVDDDTAMLPPIPGMPPLRPPAADTLREPINPDLQITVPANRRTDSPGVGSEQPIQLTFDDGQVHTVRSGAIVGRNPNKEQVPVGYTAITVRSEHVSRRHWRVDFIDGRPTVFDLGSQAGTSIETATGSRPVTVAGITVQDEERIVFADRTATVEWL